MNIITIPEEWGVLRKVPTSRENMRPTPDYYLSKFDFTTLIVDAIRTAPDQVTLICPPLYDLIKNFKITDGKSELKYKHIRLDRVDYLIVNSRDKVYFENPLKTIEIPVNQRSTKFDSMLLMATNQRDEPLSRIKEWVGYYYNVHGIRGFLFYNNLCEDHTAEELTTMLEAEYPDIVLEVLEFNISMGSRCVEWNSDYGLYIKFEHIKQKYAWCAKILFNNDMDELLVLYNGLTIDSIYKQLIDTNSIGIVYGIQNMDPYNERLGVSAVDLPVDEVHYKDYCYVGRHLNISSIYGEGSFAKWLIIPQRAMNIQWKTHYVGHNQNCLVVQKQPKQILASHFRSHQNMFIDKGLRNKSTAGENDLVKDEYLEKLLNSL